MIEAINVIKEWKNVCKSHTIEVEDNKYLCKCENCQIKDTCINLRKPFGLSDDEINKLVKKITISAVKE